ncbi:hypothetical protein [Aliiroseovarius crassostreae]|uniref:hypothetical protein n=1 Tax=Aliiroseovarius crassostreae TaxID=154981 RepID=UPI003C7B53B4
MAYNLAQGVIYGEAAEECVAKPRLINSAKGFGMQLYPEISFCSFETGKCNFFHAHRGLADTSCGPAQNWAKMLALNPFMPVATQGFPCYIPTRFR